MEEERFHRTLIKKVGLINKYGGTLKLVMLDLRVVYLFICKFFTHKATSWIEDMCIIAAFLKELQMTINPTKMANRYDSQIQIDINCVTE